MSAEVPSRFGPYEILGRLGAGGMGAVYRARDTRLQREVALKILPESSASSPDRQRRFTQEAVAASALNHPNILSVYDVGVEHGTPYLVSELIDGVSLRQEMDRGRMPLKRVLDIAAQIADGLSAAHDAGIVHRDLKPDNVMITRGSRVKILDFGLAKTTTLDSDDLAAPAALTQTAAGLIVGTVPYMSPEQARGERVDFRSDQFSFGLVMYEMVTGVHPFRRDTAVQTLSAIIGDEAPLPPETSTSIPVPVRWTIERLLSKDPHERYAHTADLAADLRKIRDRGADYSGVALRPVSGPRTVWLRSGLAASAIVAAVIVGYALRAPTGNDVTQYKFTPFATDAGYQGAPAWSPDGKTLAYVAEVDGVLQVFTKARGSSRRVQVTRQVSDCHDPFWAPDGATIYYHALAGSQVSLWRVSSVGGDPETLPSWHGAAHADISPDGRTLAFVKARASDTIDMTLWFASPPEAEPKQQTLTTSSSFTDVVIHYSPDGSKLLLWVYPSTAFADDKSVLATGFWLMSPPGSTPRQILPALAGPHTPAFFSWLPDNRHIVVVRAAGVSPGVHLWLADTESGSVRPLTVTNSNEGYAAVAPDGTIAFTSETTDFDLLLLPTDGKASGSFLSSTRNELDPAWSPKAAEYAYVTDQTGAPEIWLRSEDGSFEDRLVTQSQFERSSTIAFGALAFSPDGQRIAYQRFGSDGGYKIWISSRAGGSPVRLMADERFQDAPSWSPDGASIAFVIADKDRQSLARIPLGRAATPVVLNEHLVPFTRPQWSPDGRWILFEGDEGLGLISPDGKTGRSFGHEEWIAYTWSADSTRAYALRTTDDSHHFMLVSIDVETGQQRVLIANGGPIPQANQPIRGLTRTPGGLLTSIARVRSDVWLLEGFRPPPSFLGRFWRR